MAREKRDWDAMLQQVKRNPNLSGRQRQAATQRILQEKRQESQRQAATADPTPSGQTRTEATPAPQPVPDNQVTNPDRINRQIDRIWEKL